MSDVAIGFTRRVGVVAIEGQDVESVEQPDDQLPSRLDGQARTWVTCALASTDMSTFDSAGSGWECR